jgi:phosphatidylserine decarboxylase
MKKNSYVLKEGYKNIFIVFGVSLFIKLFVSNFLGCAGMTLAIFLIYVYRDNYRHIFSNTQNILAPIDGTITAIDNTNGKYKIYCKVGILNNHVLRSPIDGELKVKKYKRGLNLNPNTYKASLYNEQIVLKFDNLKLKLISGLCNHNMKRVKECKVSQGDKIAVFLDGLAIITIPKDNELMINVGDKLTSGQTILFKK